MAFLKTIPIKASLYDAGQFEKEIEAALHREGEIVKRAYERTVRTWEHKPRFYVRVSKVPRRAQVEVYTDDPQYNFVDYGTRIRWAVMSRDFAPKTRSNVIGSRQGRGGALVRGRNTMQKRGIAPRPGIQARNFTVEIFNRRKKYFNQNVRRAISIAATRRKRQR